MSANNRLRIAGIPLRRGRGIIGNSLHYLGKLANGEEAYQHIGAAGKGWLYLPKASVGNALTGTFKGHGLKRKSKKKKGKGFSFRIL